MLCTTNACTTASNTISFKRKPALASDAGIAVSADTVTLSGNSPPSSKEQLIRGLFRRCPDEATAKRVVDILSAYPTQALEIVQKYGTRIEVYDFEAGEQPPEYMSHLSNPQYLGCYNELANVLGVDKKNATAIPILHEFAHALDAAMRSVSKEPAWKGACTLATTTNRLVRPYAGTNSCEYMAESTAAYLIADEQLLPVIEDGLAHHQEEAYNLDEHGFMQWHQNYCNGRLQTMDPDGFKLVDDLLQRRIFEEKPAAPMPALDEAAYRVAVEKDRESRSMAS